MTIENMTIDNDAVAYLAKLASDYGPFLFAILFTVIIPFRALQIYRDCIAKYPQPSDQQRELICQSELYFRSAWIAGFVLIALSIGWWLYLNGSRLIIINKGYYLSYEGEIVGATGDDNIDGGSDSGSGPHIFLSLNSYHPLRYSFHILTHTPISAPTAFPLLWLSNQKTAGQESGYDGTQIVSLRYDPAIGKYQFRRVGGLPTIQAGGK